MWKHMVEPGRPQITV